MRKSKSVVEKLLEKRNQCSENNFYSTRNMRGTNSTCSWNALSVEHKNAKWNRMSGEKFRADFPSSCSCSKLFCFFYGERRCATHEKCKHNKLKRERLSKLPESLRCCSLKAWAALCLMKTSNRNLKRRRSFIWTLPITLALLFFKY